MADARDGAGTIRRAVDLFFERVLADPVLAPWFDGVDLGTLRTHQRVFLTAAVGGPELYTGRDMRTAHLPLRIDDAAFDLAVAHLIESMHEAGVSSDALSRIAAQLEPLRSQIVAA